MNSLKIIIKKYFPFIVTPGRNLLNSIHGFKKYKNYLLWLFLGIKIQRNQWLNPGSDSWKTYDKIMSWSWEETRINSPTYFERIKFAVEKSKGKILEIGCGIGTMTKWLSQSDRITNIVAIDSFHQAIKVLQKIKLDKVYAKQMSLEKLSFNNIDKFDTVLICEVIEHIYPDEELEMLRRLQQYIDKTTSFIVSTPIGWMLDEFHARGFTKISFLKHIEKYYGSPLEISYTSGYSQSVFGYFSKFK